MMGVSTLIVVGSWLIFHLGPGKKETHLRFMKKHAERKWTQTVTILLSLLDSCHLSLENNANGKNPCKSSSVMESNAGGMTQGEQRDFVCFSV